MSRFGEFARGFGRLVPAGAARAFGQPAAVFFHGVERQTRDPRIQTNHHERDAFVAIVRTLKAAFNVLPLSAIGDVLRHPERHRRAVFLMSDDGYANTLTEAADILEDHRLPWTLFVSTHHVETGEASPIFLLRLFAFFIAEGRYQIPHLGEIAVADAGRSDLADGIEWRLRGLDMDRAQEAVAAMVACFDSQTLSGLLNMFRSEGFLDWDGVRALARRGVEIGAHAHHHWPMNNAQSPEQLRKQAEEPRRRIAEVLGACRYFAYPFGNIGDISPEARRAVRDAGYDYGFTTLSGSLDAQASRFLLPRYELGSTAAHLTTFVSMLRTGNPRVSRFQRALAG